jgi:hypothetical protein
VDHVNVPEDMDIEEQYSRYRTWLNKRSGEYKCFPEWLIAETEATRAENVEQFYEL